MRKEDKIIMWPAYFDSTKKRSEGRRIPRSLAVPYPKNLEIKEAAAKIKLISELVSDASYPKTPWLKTGMLLVTKKEPKTKLIKKIASCLPRIRNAAAAK